MVSNHLPVYDNFSKQDEKQKIIKKKHKTNIDSTTLQKENNSNDLNWA